jgi:hypothetical protein
MSAKTAEEVQGYEYDWLACDQAGQVALLSTAGGGFTPRAFLANTDVYDRAIDALQKLPTTTLAKFARQVEEGLPNTWKEVAERGVFSFDSDAQGGPYRLAGVPARPALVDEFPPAVADVIRRIKLKTVQFAAVKEITREDVLEREAG